MRIFISQLVGFYHNNIEQIFSTQLITFGSLVVVSFISVTIQIENKSNEKPYKSPLVLCDIVRRQLSIIRRKGIQTFSRESKLHRREG